MVIGTGAGGETVTRVWNGGLVDHEKLPSRVVARVA